MSIPATLRIMNNMQSEKKIMNQIGVMKDSLPVVDEPVQVDLGETAVRSNKGRRVGLIMSWFLLAVGVLWAFNAVASLFTLFSQQDNPSLVSITGTAMNAGLGAIFPLGAAVVVWLTTVRGKPKFHEQPPPPAPEWLLNNREFGQPGRGLAGQHFEQAAAEAGTKGEVATAAILRKTILPAIPAARLFHGLRWPGTQSADIDHALVVGNVVVLIDSKFYRNAAYHWDHAEEVLYRDGERSPMSLKLGNAVRSAQPHMHANGGGVSPTGVVIIHAASESGLDAPAKITTSGAPQYGAPIIVGNPVMALGALYNLAVKNNSPATMNVPLLMTVRSWMY